MKRICEDFQDYKYEKAVGLSKLFIALFVAIKYTRRNTRRYGEGAGGSYGALMTKHKNELKYALMFQARLMYCTVESEFL